MVVGYDLHDTILDLVDLPGTGEGDGVSLKPLLAGEALPNRPDLYWEHHAGGLGSRPLGSTVERCARGTHRSMPDALEIFDIVADPGETTDLAVDRPDLVARFESLFAQRARWPHCHPGTHSATVKWRWFLQRTIPRGEVVDMGMLHLAPDESIDVQGTLDGLNAGLVGGNFRCRALCDAASCRKERCAR